ncbi:MAG: phosphomannomutase, partial [Candidatus Eremiobacterota bacterium]
VEGYDLVGLLAEQQLARHPGSLILHDPRLTWNTLEVVTAAGGRVRQIPTGHVYFKRHMQETGAVYAGEMSAHHYYRSFGGCDSGMLPWLCLVDRMNRSGKGLAELVSIPRARYPVSGEINRSVADSRAVLEAIRSRYAGQALREDRADGLSLEFPTWRFNVRASNTEPLLRLNVETRGDPQLLEERTAELLEWMR